ncbi:MAG TPA: 2-hydroxy-3-oxopropionate reductase [Spirochaetia bacterium]|nr:2-hydroxy-3-oxopropionate reductase [Spirochaetia bacterium]
MNENSLRIGFIGLGIMGRPMAKHLLAAGHTVRVYDIVEASVKEVVTAGAAAGRGPADVAKECDFLLTMLPDSPDVEKVALGPGGIIEGIRPGTCYADMSTIAPVSAIKVAKALSEKGARCLDAPVSGGQTGAEQATLSIMVGGARENFDRFLPIFEKLGKTITLCGDNGAGQTVKACNQIQVAMNLVGMAEALVLGAKAGVDPEIVVRVLSGGYAQTRVMDVRGPKVIKGDFAPGFKSRFHYKDLNIIMNTARDYGVPLPATSVVHELFGAMLAQGNGELDHSGVITVIESLAKIEARTKSK